MGDFVRPEPIRLSLSGGHYVDIKKRLNHGEREDMFARIAPNVVPGEEAQLNRREVRTAQVLTYLLGWSLVDDEGTPVAFSPVLPEADRLDTIRSLDPDRFDEIYRAIQTHEQAYAKKKALSTVSASSATSPSPVAVTGDMSGSAN